MNTGQSMLAIGAMILLSTLVLRVNNNFLSTKQVMNESKFGVLATSLATSLIEEASNKNFDHVTDGNPIINVNLLTSHTALKKESGEAYPDFNDFDDYNGYTKTISNLPSAVYKLSCKVEYVEPPNLEVPVAKKTWHKKITVTVASESSQDTVRLSSVFSYWFFP
jgi:MSHA pilin protein MshD